MKFNDISNIIFKIFVIFSVSFFWINYYLRNFLSTFLISIAISLILTFIIKTIEKKKNNKSKLTKKDNENIKNLKNQFTFNSNKNNKVYLQKLLNLNKKMQLNLNGTNYLVLPFLSVFSIGEYEIAIAFKKSFSQSQNNIIIICNEITPDALKLAYSIKECEIKILTIETLYFNFIKPSNLFPKNVVTFSEKKKYKLKELFKFTFNKNNSKKFLKLGLFTYFLSIFTFYKLYYLIFGTILIAISLVCKLQKNNSNFKNEIFYN